MLKHNAAEKIVEAIHAVMRGGMALDPEVASTAAGASGGDEAGEGDGMLAESGDDPLGHLSPTERRVLAEVAEGLTDKEVATAVGISVKSVRKRLAGIFQKLGVHSRTQAARKHAWGRGS